MAILVAAVEELTGVVNLVGGFAMGSKVAATELGDFQRMLERRALPRLRRLGRHQRRGVPVYGRA